MLQGIPKALSASALPPRQEGRCQPRGDETSRSLWRCAPAALWSVGCPSVPVGPRPAPAAPSSPATTKARGILHQFPRKQKKLQPRAPSGDLGRWGCWVPGPCHGKASIPLELCSQTRCVLRMGTVSSKTPWALTSVREICTFACERNE